jgi:hypothetical protein
LPCGHETVKEFGAVLRVVDPGGLQYRLLPGVQVKGLITYQVASGGFQKMQKLAIAIVLVAMLAIGLAGVAGASGNCDMKNGCCEDGHAKTSHSKKKKKGSQPQTQSETAPAGNQGATK